MVASGPGDRERRGSGPSDGPYGAWSAPSANGAAWGQQSEKCCSARRRPGQPCAAGWRASNPPKPSGCDVTSRGTQSSCRRRRRPWHAGAPRSAVRAWTCEAMGKAAKNDPEEVTVNNYPKGSMVMNNLMEKVVVDSMAVFNPTEQTAMSNPEKKMVSNYPSNEVVKNNPKRQMVTDGPTKKMVMNNPEIRMEIHKPIRKPVTGRPVKMMVNNYPKKKMVMNNPEEKMEVHDPTEKTAMGNPAKEMVNNHPKKKTGMNNPLINTATGRRTARTRARCS